MLHDRKPYNKINKILERALRIIHKDSTSYFQELPVKSNSMSVHQWNLQLLLAEDCRSINKLNLFSWGIYLIPMLWYNLRGSTNLALPKSWTNLYAIDTVRFAGQKLWQNLPENQ